MTTAERDAGTRARASQHRAPLSVHYASKTACAIRFDNLSEATFIERGRLHPYPQNWPLAIKSVTVTRLPLTDD